MQNFKTNYDREILKQILDCFVELTGIKASFFNEYNELMNGKDQGNCEFCRNIKKYPELKKLCTLCDERGISEAKAKKTVNLYKCHIGLWEAVVPITIEGRVTGFLMLGQVSEADENRTEWIKKIKEFKYHGITDSDIKELIDSYNEIKILEKNKIEAAVKMLSIMAEYIVKSEAIKILEMETIEKAKKFIKNNFSEPIKSKDIAIFVNLSPSYFSYFFKKQTGRTITDYIEIQRMNAAKDMLLKTSLSISEIAYKTGYNDQNYFSRVFKKNEGISPKDYRIIHVDTL